MTQNPTTNTEAGAVADVAAKLTEAQRRIVCEMPVDRHYVDAYIYCRQRRTRMALTNIGVTEPRRQGAMTTWWMIRLSDRGLAVRQHLEQGATAGVAEMNEQMFGQGDK